MNDSFDNGSLNTSLWSTQYPSGNSGEQQFYADSAVSVSGDGLSINATPTPANGYSFTSGIIHTRDKFYQKYGRFEIKTRLPKGQGFWPAFWLLPNKPDFPVEIDVFEMKGSDPTKLYLSLHWKGADGSNEHTTVPYSNGTDFSAGFHTFTIEWTSDRLTWLVDGQQAYTTTDHVPDVPMFILANLAVGGSFPGSPNSSTPWPGVMQIQYVRAEAQTCSFNLLHWLFPFFYK